MNSASRSKSVEVTNLEKSFGSFKALSEVSFEIDEGSTVALLGPSGCGKTTILRCLAGLEPPDGGHIRIGGQTVYDSSTRLSLPPERRNVGVVFQSYAIWPHMSVAENIGFPLKLRGVARATIASEVDRMLDIVGLLSAREKMATQLSGGQQQRVAIARALINSPKLVLFDEALSNLDAQMREQMRLELQLLQARIGFTALYVTHDQTEAFALAERVIVMNRGFIETWGPPVEVFRNPATPFVAEFMGLNLLPGRIKGRAGPDQSGEVICVTSGGIEIKGVTAARSPLADDSPALIGVRKEHFFVTPDTTSNGNGDYVTKFHAEVIASSFLGVHREYLLRVGSQEIKAILSRHDLRVGDQINLSVHKDNVVVFNDPE